MFSPSSNFSTNAPPSVPPAPFQVNPTLGLVVEVVILFLVCGHFLIITTLSLYKPWNIADLLLFSLSVADAINAAIPLQMLNLVNNFIGPETWSQASCAVFVILTYTFRIASVCTITLISGDRAILLTRPLQHHIIVTIGRARIAIVAIWLFSIFMSILPFIGVGTSGYRNGFCFYQLFDFGLAYGYVIESIGIIQLIIVLVCFIAIKLSSGRFVKRQSTMAASRQTGGKNKQARETAGTRQVKQMSTMMAIVVVLYYISWLPYLVSFSVRVCVLCACDGACSRIENYNKIPLQIKVFKLTYTHITMKTFDESFVWWHFERRVYFRFHITLLNIFVLITAVRPYNKTMHTKILLFSAMITISSIEN